MCDRKRTHPPPLGMLDQEVGQGKKDCPSPPLGDLIALSSVNKSPLLSENSRPFTKAKKFTWSTSFVALYFCDFL